MYVKRSIAPRLYYSMSGCGNGGIRVLRLEDVGGLGLISGVQVFMNIVLDEAFEEKQGGEKVAIGMSVRTSAPPVPPWECC